MLLDGVTCVGEVDGTVETAIGLVAKGTESTGIKTKSCLVPPLVMTFFTCSEISAILPFTVTAALSKIRALGWIWAGVYGSTKLKGDCLPWVRMTRCEITVEGTLGKVASDSVTVKTASGGNAMGCRIQTVPVTAGCVITSAACAVPGV